MKQAEHDKIVAVLREQHEEEIKKLRSDNDVLIKQVAKNNERLFNDGANHASRHTQIAICKGFVDLIQELYLRGAKQMEREQEAASAEDAPSGQ
jgi:hypothetical protein